ncbi:MAG: SpoIIE family protein phosphatase [Pseudomonadota bacterium]
MQTRSAETPSETADATAPVFRHVRSALAYEDMHAIRKEVSGFLQLRHVSKERTGNLLLGLTEILTNLVKHPVRKADHIEIRIGISETQTDLEVLDNSTPFANFDEKCENALSMLHAAETKAECGYGLGCILTLFKNPVYLPMNTSPDRLNHFRIFQDRYPAMLPAGATAQRKKKIFLVDDDQVSLLIHERMLNDIYEIIPFESARDALAAFAHHKPDLIISDLTMPDMDGTALRKALAGAEGGDTTPFIFLSGHRDRENSPYISHLGVDDFLCKPVSSERLHAVLTRLLHRSRQIRDSVQGQFHHDITELLKPSLPENYGAWKLVTRHMVADAGGGDFILHQQTPESLMVVLADVMGHGRQAKFFSCVYAGYLHGMFRMDTETPEPCRFLRCLSQSIDGDPLLENMIMTCQCFQFFPEGLLKIASAGHPCPIHLRGGRAERIDVTGPLPGLVGDSFYDMKSVRPELGDKILFMTDGFLETFDQRGLAAQALLKQVQDAPPGPASVLADHLWREFLRKQQEQPVHRDDATIIIAEYGGTT